MDVLYNQTLRQLDKSFRRLEVLVPPPYRMRHVDSFVFRYREQTLLQALLQKLARMVSGLHAARMLCDKGFFQEQGAMQRILDELHEDIWFLAFAEINRDVTQLHRDYLDAFYREEFDPVTGAALLDRPMVPRRKIRAYLSRLEEAPWNPSDAVRLYHTVHSGLSGFVHGASSHIMDMWGGDPPRFHLHGMTGTPLEASHRHELYNPFFRAILSFAIAAKAFGDDKLCGTLTVFHKEFDRLSGRHEAYLNSSPRRS